MNQLIRKNPNLDAFGIVQDDLERAKTYAFERILKTKYEELEKGARYNLQLKGKNFRSAILYLLSKALSANTNSYTQIDEQVTCLAACIEICHNSSLLQDDIVDNADSRRNEIAAHKVFGVSSTVYASNFMIARASRMLTEVFPNSDMSQIFSTVLYNLVFGELIQARRDMDSGREISGDGFDTQGYFESYVSKTYFKTASMLSLACRGVGLILDLDHEAQKRLFDFGAHLGIAFQVHDDILDFTQSGETLGKPAFNDLKEVSFAFKNCVGNRYCANHIRHA